MTNRFRITALIALSGLALVGPPAAAPAQCAVPPGLDGLWLGNDHGNYYLRQVGNEVWWVGLDGDTDGAGWTHTFRGLRSGNTINGRWVDVRGNIGVGQLTLRVQGYRMVSTYSSNHNFGGSSWDKQPC
jgi:hypothetical protein